MKSPRDCSFLRGAVLTLAGLLGSQAMTSRSPLPHPEMSKENFLKQKCPSVTHVPHQGKLIILQFIIFMGIK
jgi:hypothetical protein